MHYRFHVPSINSSLINLSYNITPYKFLILYLSNDIEYGDSLSVEDSTILNFKLIMKKDGDAQKVCFSKKFDIEFVYYDENNGKQADTKNLIYDCNKIVMLVQKVKIEPYDYNVKAYDTLSLIMLKVKVDYGEKPYKYHWGGNFSEDLDSVFIQNPLKPLKDKIIF